LKNLKKITIRFGGILASLALMITSLNVNTTCMLIAHQPKMPEEAKKLRKF
jgi:cyclic lactone autoinducer peptide